MPPKVSIIIVNYNGQKYVDRCVASVFENIYPDYEVVVVDNGSNDGSVSLLREKYGQRGNFKLVTLSSNLGPSAARNKAAAQATGKYLALLDNDTVPEPDWLIEPVKAMEADATLGACQCKLLLLKNPKQLDYTGDYISQYGFLVQRVETGDTDIGQSDQRVEILSAKSAAMLIRRAAFDRAGGFDPDYFIYVEETDLGWRTWLAGYRIIFIPESRVLHEFGTSSVILPNQQNFLSKFHGTKNYIMTLAKNFGTVNYLTVIPIHVFLWLAMASVLCFKGQRKSGLYITRGVWWTITHAGSIRRKRRRIQAQRQIEDKKLMPIVRRRKPLKYFYGKFSKPVIIGNTKSFNRPKNL